VKRDNPEIALAGNGTAGADSSASGKLRYKFFIEDSSIGNFAATFAQ
jgi:hypothetical protein